MAGRHSKLTPEVIQRACARIEKTGDVVSSFVLEGVAPTTVRWWIRIAEGRDEQNPPTPRFLSFLSDVQSAKARHKAALLELEVAPVQKTVRKQVKVQGPPTPDGKPGTVRTIIDSVTIESLPPNAQAIDRHLRRENPEDYPDVKTVKHGIDSEAAQLIETIKALRAKPYVDPRLRSLPAGGDDDENVVDAETVEPVESKTEKRPLED